MNLATTPLLTLFRPSVFCTTLPFPTPVLSFDTVADDIDNGQGAYSINLLLLQLAKLAVLRFLALLNVYVKNKFLAKTRAK